MFNRLFFLNTIILSILFSGCSSYSIKKEDKKDEFDYLIDLPIKKYELLCSYEDTTKVCKKIKLPLVINYVETHCSRCVLELKNWSSFIKENKEIMSKINFIVIAAGEPDFYFDYNYKSKKYYDFHIYKDPNFRFIDYNSIGDIMIVKTLIVGKDGKVCFYGSPVLNQQLKQPFLKKIREQLKK